MSSAMDPSKMKVIDLRQELSQRGLDTKGNKPALVKRLKDALEKELKQELPDTSIADTSTEDFDTSQLEESSSEKMETEEDNPKDEPTSPQKSSSPEKQSPSPQKQTPSPQKQASSPEKSSSPQKQGSSPNKQEDACQRPGQVQNENPKEGDSKVEENGDHEGDAKATSEDASQPATEDSEEKREESESKGEKRKRDGGSPDRAPKKRERSPIKEDEPPIEEDKVQLSWYDSDLHLQLDKETFVSAKPLHDGVFGYAWAGARASHGVSSGKIYYEVKLTEELKWEDLGELWNNERQNRERNRNRRSRDQPRGKDRDKRNADKKDDKKSESKPSEGEDGEKSEKPKEAEETKEGEEQAEKMETDEQAPEDKKEEKEDEEKMEDESAEKVEEEKVEKTEEEKTEEKSEEEKPAEESEAPKEGDADKEKSEKTEAKEGDSEKDDNVTVTVDLPSIPTHIFRVGFSLASCSLQLGEEKHSYAYESSGRFVTESNFEDYGVKFGVGDVVGAFLNIEDNKVTITYTVNGEAQPTAVTIPRSELPEDFAFFPHILTRNIVYEVNFGDKEEAWFPVPDSLNDYEPLSKVEDKVEGPRRPETRKECEVILMVGLPNSGKTYWAQKHIESNPDKRYNIIGNIFLDRMKVDGKPLKTRFKGRWNILIDRVQKCINKLIEMASVRRRNVIIDQTNVYPSAQRRKLRSFEGFERRAVVVVVGDEEHARRQAEKEAAHGKDYPDYLVLDMKASLSLPEKGDWVDDVIYAELNEEESKELVKKYNEAGKEAGYGNSRRNPRRDDRWGNRRNDYGGRNYYDRPYQRYDRQGGWNRQGGGGWGRDRRDDRGPPQRNWNQGGRSQPRDSRSGGSYGRQGGGQGWRQSWGGSGSGGSNWNQQTWGHHGSGQGGWGKYDQGGYGGGYGGQGGYGSNWNNYYGQYGQGQGGWSQQKR